MVSIDFALEIFAGTIFAFEIFAGAIVKIRSSTFMMPLDIIWSMILPGDLVNDQDSA